MFFLNKDTDKGCTVSLGGVEGQRQNRVEPCPGGEESSPAKLLLLLQENSDVSLPINHGVSAFHLGWMRGFSKKSKPWTL